MQSLDYAPLEPDVHGVRPADQERSRRLQQRFIETGRSMLLKTRLSDLSIPELAQGANSSVGGFYSRFASKSAFFDFMRFKMFEEHARLHDAHLAPLNFEGETHLKVSTAVVDLMLLVYSGPWRGVLREGYSAIPHNPESWEPMTQRGETLRQRILPMFAARVAQADGLEERVSFAVQLLFSALNNELMNASLAFGINDPRFRHFLVVSFDTLVSNNAAHLSWQNDESEAR